ncbi:MAG TPA: Calx-beta domain-containing protein [Thermoanaerobaculia bacterium]|nr:Calx-beta domain-containing protein [Thermoanaerobaculia bacterium]
MRRAVFVTILLFAIRTFADCTGQTYPSQYTVDVHSPVCNAKTPCLQNHLVHFAVTPRSGSCYIPLYPGPCPAPYVIDSCDTLTWDFNDGTPKQIVHGSGEVNHAFPTPGNYVVNIDINGTGNIHGSAYICADPPAYVRFTKSSYNVSESAPSVTVTLERSGDTARAFTLDYSTFPNGAEFVRNLEPLMTKISFGAGETTKTITHRLQDDSVFNGDSDHSIGVLSDGAAIMDAGPVTTSNIHVIDDEQGAEFSIDDVTVPEGNDIHPVTFTVRLSKPASDRVYAWCVPHDGTAIANFDFKLQGSTAIIEPGQTSATCHVDIVGNIAPGPDKTFTVTTDPVLGPVTIKKATALCTLLNDDAIIPVKPALWFVQKTLTLTAGEVDFVTLNATPPVQATLMSSDPSIVRVGTTASAPGSVRLTAVNPGRATITASKGELTATIDIEVAPAPRRRAMR